MSHLHTLAASTKRPGGNSAEPKRQRRKSEDSRFGPSGQHRAAFLAAHRTCWRRSAIGIAHCRNQAKSQRGWGQTLRLLLGI
ncbi:hypothetical protein M441DRAFT_114024, partial [Trichoderma asperellum CBS 433.97]